MIDIYDELRRLITMLDERKLIMPCAVVWQWRPSATANDDDIDLLIQAESLDKLWPSPQVVTRFR